MRAGLLLLLVASAAGDDCPNSYYVFNADTGKDTCFFRVERRCSNGVYSNLPRSERYTYKENNQGFYLENATDADTPSLPDACKTNYLQKLFVSPQGTGNGQGYLFYPQMNLPISSGDYVPFESAYPFTVYKDKWYQGLVIKLYVFGQTFVIQEIIESSAVIQQDSQPSNTKPADAVDTFSTNDWIAIAGGVSGFVVIVIIVILATRHKNNDVRS